MAERVLGNVKWFSNKKGYGFITPAEGATVAEDIFVHQSSIHCDGYRTLVSLAFVLVVCFQLISCISVGVSGRQPCMHVPNHASSYVLHLHHLFLPSQDEGWEVEFEIGHDDDGKVKAISVTAPGGGPCTGVRKSRRPRERREGGGNNNGGGKAPAARAERGSPKPKEPFWHEILSDDVKGAIAEKKVRTSSGTIDVAVGDARVKLGTRGYSSMAHADGIIAEGTFECGADGNATFVWEHCITFDSGSGQWVLTNDKAAELLSALSLSDGTFALNRLLYVRKTFYVNRHTHVHSFFLCVQRKHSQRSPRRKRRNSPNTLG